MRTRSPKEFAENLNFVVEVMTEVARNNFDNALTVFREGIVRAISESDRISGEEVQYALGGLDSLVRLKLDQHGDRPIIAGERCEEHQCAFCGKPESQVDLLIAGALGNICSSCVNICNEVISAGEK